MQKHEPEKLRVILLQLLKEHKLSVNGWAKRASISEGALRHFVKGSKDNITYSTLFALARAIGLTVEELMNGGQLQSMSLKVSSVIPCVSGEFGKIKNEPDIEWANASKNMIAVRVGDTSMSRIAAANAIVIIDTTQNEIAYLDGKTVLAEVNGLVLLRVFNRESLELTTASIEKVASKAIKLENNDNWRLIGKAVGVISYLPD